MHIPCFFLLSCFFQPVALRASCLKFKLKTALRRVSLSVS
nr:MAG TPA: hypothetical protein [Caudoviricetes sp.]